jgi:hypothetical protein
MNGLVNPGHRLNYIQQMKYLITLVCSFSIVSTAIGQNRPLPNNIKLKDHPRILLLKDEEKLISNAIAANPIWKKLHETIVKECDVVIGLPPLERVQVGRRLLETSREALRRIYYLSYAYRLTQEEKYFQRVKKELLAVCDFNDWNPSHFLDVAEMTLAVSIGYDWFFDKFSPEEKQLMRNAIVKKGLEPSFDKQYNWFVEANQNWNQVCNAGMTYGALVVWEDHTEISRQVVQRALNTIHLSMEQYKPDGGYPEGYGYWNYGTSFNILFLSAIEKVFDTDFGLSEIPGFMKTASFMENMTGNTGLCYNWADCMLTGNLKPTMFWFAQRNNDPSLLWMEKQYLLEGDYARFTKDRLLPNVMIWGKDISLDKVVEPKQKVWVGQGMSPVAAMRTSWDKKGIYLGFKAGVPSSGHGHMDVGSFILESDGVRWASDFGMQDYESLESKGMEIFGRTQDATRWTIFYMNSYSHNIVTVDSLQQRVDGYASIEKFSDKPAFSYAIADVTAAYKGQLAGINRGVGIVNGKYVVVRDELKALDKQVTIRWAMLTSADVKITGMNTAELTKEHKKLLLKVNSTENIKMKTWSTAPTNDYDAPNPGTVLVGFETIVPAKKEIAQTVLLIPFSAEKFANGKIKSLKEWSE